ncbi:PaaX family transcriptional regulator C-terminal domain-containing protein [Dietzia cercidiphylli]|uniref:PaaX family transcriptional regulator C-terminal domain-containing protein n=1 Tax=Dietzia cercidiphylli TaxID=498199 RepID=UPI003F8178D7
MPAPARPIKLPARSAVLSALLGAHPAESTAAGIVDVAVRLGFQESAVRVALTRMVASGDLERDRGVYRLSPRLISRQERQDAAISPSLKPWDRQWSMQVVTVPADAATRLATRSELTGLRYAELREGVWLRPANLDVVRSDALTARSEEFSCVPAGDVDALTSRLFDPAGWARDGAALLAAAEHADEMSTRFEVAAATVRHILHDPLLPAELLPADWPGERLRESYQRFRTDFGRFANGVLGAGT